MIVDSDVQVLPPNPVVHVDIAGAARNPVADSGDSTKLLHIEMQEIARPRVLVPLSHRWGAQAPAARQAGAAQDPRRGGGTHPDRVGNLGARPPLHPQHFHPQRDRRGCPAGARVRPTRSIRQTGRPLGSIADDPLVCRAPRDPELASNLDDPFARANPINQFPSTMRRESGILVDVHPGLPSRASNDLAATTFPRLAWVNNLLLRHT